jgi:hypothetical protein
MDSTTGFSSNFSIPTTRISRGWSTRMSLLKTRSKRWTRMARGKHHSWDSLRDAAPGLACLSRAFLLKPEYGSSTNACTVSSIIDVVTELSGALSKLPDAEASATGSSTQCAATTSLKHIARPSPNSSNIAECTSSRKP